MGYGVEELVIVLLNKILRGSSPFHRIDFYHVGSAFYVLPSRTPTVVLTLSQEAKDKRYFFHSDFILVLVSFFKTFFLEIFMMRAFQSAL